MDQKILYKNKSGKAEMLGLKKPRHFLYVHYNLQFFSSEQILHSFLPNMILEIMVPACKGINSNPGSLLLSKHSRILFH